MSAPRVAVVTGLAGILIARAAAAAVCGNGSCDPGETAETCASDCVCHDTSSTDYALCCHPSGSGTCTPKAQCWYVEAGGCCCASFDPFTFTCLSCAPKQEIPGWCGGGIGAFEGHGACGGAPACEDTELTDTYLGGVNVRTRCVTTEIPLGQVMGGKDFSLDVTIVYNEGRPVPEEIAGTDFYGTGGWLSTDKIITDEGLFWLSKDTEGQRQPHGVLRGSRMDINGNGYVGYTLHTPHGSRTYDYPVVLDAEDPASIDQPVRKPTGVFRSEPFDGRYLRIDGGTYTLFQYPRGPYEVYSDPLPGANVRPELASARLFKQARAHFAAELPFPYLGRTVPFLKDITVQRESATGRTFAVESELGWRINLAYSPLPDGSGRRIEADFWEWDLTELDQALKIETRTATITTAVGRVTSFTQPGREEDSVVSLDWDEWRLRSSRMEVKDDMDETVMDALTTYERSLPRITAIEETQTLLGTTSVKETTRFASCDVNMGTISGTRVIFPRNVSVTFEYGEGGRLRAHTDATGARTEYSYLTEEPRGELSDWAEVDVSGVPIELGLGMHIDWDFVTQKPLDAALFPSGTFSGMPASKGIPVPRTFWRHPDGLVLDERRDPMTSELLYDPAVLRPNQIIDAHGRKRQLEYYPDTGELKSERFAGLTTKYVRSPVATTSSIPVGAGGEAIEVVLVGTNGAVDATLVKSIRDEFGFPAAEVHTGLEFDPDSPPGRKFVPITIERVTQHKHGIPLNISTRTNGIPQAVTTPTWDTRRRGILGSSTMVNGQPYASFAPMAGGRVDGLGTPRGPWRVTGPGRQLDIVADRTPGSEMLTINGQGTRTVTSGGAMAGSLETDIEALAPTGATPVGSVTSMPASTAMACE